MYIIKILDWVVTMLPEVHLETLEIYGHLKYFYCVLMGYG